MFYQVKRLFLKPSPSALGLLRLCSIDRINRKNKGTDSQREKGGYMSEWMACICRPKSNALFLGLCFPQAWMFVVSQHVISKALAFQIAFHSGMLMALIALALAFKRTSPNPRLLFHPLSAAALCVAPLARCTPVMSLASAQIATGVISGVGIAFCFSSWFLIYGSMKMKDACEFTLLGFSLGALICLIMKLVYSINGMLVLLIACILPFCSTAAARRAWEGESPLLSNRPQEKTTCKSNETKPSSSSLSLVVQVIAYAAIFGNGIIFSLLQSAIPDSPHEYIMTSIGYALRSLLPFLLFLWLVTRKNDSMTRATTHSALLIATFLLLILWFAAGTPPAVTYTMLSLARNFVLILLYLVLLKLAWRSTWHPCLVFGIGRGLYEASVIIGIAAYDAIAKAYGTFPIEEHIAQATAICVFIFLASCFFMTAQSVHSAPPAPTIPAINQDEQRWSALQLEFSLSEREIEVMRLLYQGHTKKKIADILILSENTIRWYTKQLYAKLNIHSKEELICLVHKRQQIED